MTSRDDVVYWIFKTYSITAFILTLVIICEMFLVPTGMPRAICGIVVLFGLFIGLSCKNECDEILHHRSVKDNGENKANL